MDKGKIKTRFLASVYEVMDCNDKELTAWAMQILSRANRIPLYDERMRFIIKQMLQMNTNEQL